MRGKSIIVLSVLLLAAVPGLAQETPPTLVAAYDSLATSILNLRQAEEDYVRVVLDDHFRRAKRLMGEEKYGQAAAEMALFANEGDNAVGGIRKRLIEGGHHHNAAGEEAGIFEPGYVLVTKEAKQKLLASSAALRQAENEDGRKAAWKDFATIAGEFLTK